MIDEPLPLRFTMPFGDTDRVDLVVSKRWLHAVRVWPPQHDFMCTACGGWGGRSTSEGTEPCDWCGGTGDLDPEIVACLRGWLMETPFRTADLWGLQP